MLEYIRGKLVEISLTKAVIDVGGLGFALNIPLSVYHQQPPIGLEILFFIATVIREDSHKLYGFLQKIDRDLFEKLNEVSGIGPKTSLALLGAMENSVLQSAIAAANTALLSKVPGIGKKTAERLIVEMRDKVKILEKGIIPVHSANGTVATDAIQALIHLGYNPLHAQKAVNHILKSQEKEPPLAELITAALRSI